MYQYAFRKAIFTLTHPEINHQPSPFQHLLPPQLVIEKVSQPIPSQYVTRNDDQIVKLQQEIKDKDTIILTLKERYSNLSLLYEEVKKDHQCRIRIQAEQFERDKMLLIEKVRKVERQLVECQKQLIRKEKIYEEKNTQSRKLLERLNQNITKRQQKYEKELKQANDKIKASQKIIEELSQKIEYLQEAISQKQEEMTKFQQETSRSKSTYMNNVNKLQQKLNQQNNSLKVRFASQIQQLSSELAQANDSLLLMKEIQEENQHIKSQLNLKSIQLEEAFQLIDNLQLQCKEISGQKRVIEADNECLRASIDEKTKQCLNYENNLHILKQEIQRVEQQLVKEKQKNKEFRQVQKLMLQKKTKQQIENESLNVKIKEVTEKLITLEPREHELSRQLEILREKMVEMNKMNSGMIVKLQQRQNKIIQLEELLQCYKEEKAKVYEQTSTKMRDIKNFYEDQILRLERRDETTKQKSIISKTVYR